MNKTLYKYVSQYGVLYRMTHKNFKKFIFHAAQGNEDPQKFGTIIGTVENTTNWSADDYANRINQYEETRD